VRRTYLGPLLAVSALLLFPPQAPKTKQKIEPVISVNPNLVGKADVTAPLKIEVPPTILNVFAASAADVPSTPLVADLGNWDVPAPTLPHPEFRKPLSRSKAVLDLIHYPWLQLGYEVVFLSARPGFRAMTISDKRRIEIYMRSGEAPMDTAYDLAHELGHAFDLEYNDAERRGRWCEMRGIAADTPWFGCNRCPDYSTPAGDFAETFAFLLLGPGNYHSHMAPPPKLEDVPQLAAFCRIDLGGLWYAEQVNGGKHQDEKSEPPTSKTARIAGAPR
jgi:hypothetical protein